MVAIGAIERLAITLAADMAGLVKGATGDTGLQFSKLPQPLLSLQLPIAQCFPNHFTGGNTIPAGLYSAQEFASKVRGNFPQTVLAGKKLFLIGDDSFLREPSQKKLARMARFRPRGALPDCC